MYACCEILAPKAYRAATMSLSHVMTGCTYYHQLCPMHRSSFRDILNAEAFVLSFAAAQPAAITAAAPALSGEEEAALDAELAALREQIKQVCCTIMLKHKCLFAL